MGAYTQLYILCEFIQIILSMIYNQDSYNIQITFLTVKYINMFTLSLSR